jgi:hypothetical protein
MTAATALGVFVIPVLFVVIERVIARLRGKANSPEAVARRGEVGERP